MAMGPWGAKQAGWFILETPKIMDDWYGVPTLFRETSIWLISKMVANVYQIRVNSWMALLIAFIYTTFLIQTCLVIFDTLIQ
jgi:hypothetical protein